jgi:hypothetical protein
MSSSSSASTIKVSDPNPEYDITKEDIANIYTSDGRYNQASGAAIHEKLALGFPGTLSHNINAHDYDRAFFTSDIHSDLRKFVQMLKNNRLIGTPVLAYEEDIYDPALIADSEWTGGPRTILVIIGDLVDGRRIFDKEGTVSNSVHDKRGSFEFLLFALLYNLRRKANRAGSEVLFTIGNHEYDSILRVKRRPSDYYKDYVTDEAKHFFNDDNTIRSEALLPFLKTSPYYLLSFVTPKIEVICVHGGLYSNDGGLIGKGRGGVDLFNSLLEGQKDLDKGENKLDDTFNPFFEEALNTRIYNKPGGFCDKLVKDKWGPPNLSDFLLTIVGHCPTNSNHRSLELIRSDAIYTGCDGRGGAYSVGCVVVDCKGSKDGAPDGAPKLAFVDTAMSHAFRPLSDENDIRPVQMLLLTRDSTLEDDKRYFNKIERVARAGQSGLDDAPSTILYAAPAKSSASASGAEASSSTSSSAVVETANATSTTGGRRPKRKHRTIKKRNLKKRTSRKLTSSRRTRRAIVRRL